MITNTDENFGRLNAFLTETGLSDDTSLIFMTDNGSSGGCTLNGSLHEDQGYNAGLRGKKGSYYEGGHRAPFIIRWKNGQIIGGKEIDELCLDIDMLPTFIDLCGIENPECRSFDGTSFAGLLDGSQDVMRDRIHFLNILQSTAPPSKERDCVMTTQWRFVHGNELYDIKADPSQLNDIAPKHPDVVLELSTALNAYWEDVPKDFDDTGLE